MVENVDIQN